MGRRDVALFVPLISEQRRDTVLLFEVLNKLVNEAGEVGFVVTNGTQQREDAHTALTCDASTRSDVLARLVLDVELEPFTTLRVNSALHQLVLRQVTQTVTLAGFEDDARTTNELRHDDALSSVHDEGSLFGHHREVAHEHQLLAQFAGAAITESCAHQN